MKFPEPELVLKHTISSNQGREIEVRIYRTSEIHIPSSCLAQKAWRWHFGFPADLVSCLCPLLECSPFWGGQHWTEQDGWWIWTTSIVSDSPELSTVGEQLTRELQLDLQSLNQCLIFFYKSSGAKDGSEAVAD